MSAALALLLAAQAVSSVNQTGGITAARVGNVWNGNAPSRVVEVSPVVMISTACIVRHGLFIRNKRGLYDRTPWFRAQPMARRLALLSRCEVRP